MGNPEPCESDWLELTPKDKMPQPDIVAFPKPPKAADGSLIYERIPNKGETESNKNSTGTTSPVSLKRRHQCDDVNGVAADNSECGYIDQFLDVATNNNTMNKNFPFQTHPILLLLQNGQTKIQCHHTDPHLNNMQP